MNGLTLSGSYYREWGERIIAGKYSRYQHRIAVGLVGEGSDCYGFDDEISMDHDWGPGFCLWLTSADYEIIGKDLQNDYDTLPSEFLGYRRITSRFGTERVGVQTIDSFFMRHIGLPHAPETAMQWLYLPEERLSVCTNGRVFEDQMGEFSRIRNDLLAFYPEDIRMWKMAARCRTCAQAGQYNYPRSLRRGERFAAQFAETQFCADIISLVFLLNRCYTPFYKWRHRAVRELPILGQFIYQKIIGLMDSRHFPTKINLIEEISAAVIAELRHQDLSDAAGDFLLDHGACIQQCIQDSTIRSRLM
ncbi:MAG: DUF4037 domain-containing protein [Desulfatirhabdiaceae bacterium]